MINLLLSLIDSLTTYTHNMPQIGETIHGVGFQKSFGGKGANQAVQCARLGVSTAFVGMVGKDSHGEEYKQSLKHEGIRTSYVGEGDSHTGIASIWVDEAGRNSIVIVPGANLQLSADSFQQFLTDSNTAPAKVAVFQNEIMEGSNQKCMQMIRTSTSNIVSIYNPAPATLNCKQVVPFCDILCVNEVELSMLSGLPSNTDEEVCAGGKVLLGLGCKSVVVTLGDRGAAILIAEGEGVKFSMFAAEKVKAVDTVGAGDSFIGCLAANLARGVVLSEAVVRAVKCASLSVLSKGAQPSYKYLDDISADQHPPARLEHLSNEQIQQNLFR